MRELERDPSPRGGSSAAEALPRLALVGAGRVGSALARAAEGANVEVELAGREDALEVCRRAEIALVCVPDAAIPDACEALAAAIPPIRMVGHTSGATGLDALDASRERGAEVFSLHPLQTVPDGDADMTDAPCAVSADSEGARRVAWGLAERMGMRPFALTDEARAVYHAAASMASNFLIALEESSADLLGRAGVADPREMLSPLVLRTAANWAERGGDALTGPIARGDATTVDRHLAALERTAPELVSLYEALAETTRRIARDREALSA